MGRWEAGYLTNSDDESFEQYDRVILYPYGPENKKYIELYSNGTGVTNYFWGDYYNNSGIVFEWEVAYDDFYDKELLFIYYAVEADEEEESDEFGFSVNETSPYDLSFKDAKVEGEKIERNSSVKKYDSRIETISFRFFDSYQPFVKVGDFKDNPDLGCENAFKSIASYRKLEKK